MMKKLFIKFQIVQIFLIILYVQIIISSPQSLKFPFTIISSKLDSKRSIFDNLMVTPLCFPDNGCKNISLSFSSYAPWICYNGNITELKVPNRKELFISTSHSSVSGELKNTSFITKNNQNISLSYVHVFSYNEGCFQITRKYDTIGEIGLNIKESNGQINTNLSLLEQLYNNTKDKELMKFSISYNNFNSGELIFGENNYQINPTTDLLLQLKSEKDYMNALKTTSEKVFFKNQYQQKEFNISQGLYISITNLITIFPEKHLKMFEEMNLRLGLNKYNSTFTYKNFCETKKSLFSFITVILCKKEINQIILPNITITFNNNQNITINPNEMFIDYEGKKLFCIGFTNVSTNIIIGQNFFQKFITEFNIRNNTIKIFQKNNNSKTNVSFSSSNIINSFIKTLFIFSTLLLSLFLIFFFGFVFYKQKKKEILIDEERLTSNVEEDIDKYQKYKYKH